MIAELCHVNVRTRRFDETVSFYERVLGLTASPGGSAVGRAETTWMRDQAGRALVHVNGLLPDEPEPITAAAALDHFAFRCTGLDEILSRLSGLGVAYQRRRLEHLGIVQVVVHDPNGVKIELAFDDPVS